MLSFMIRVTGAIAAALLITCSQKYLSTRKLWQLGAIVPLLSAAAISVLFFTMQITLSLKFIAPCAILFVAELFIWIDGRRQYRKKELMRMRAKDMNG